jgi:hypothetical protein
VCWHASGGGWLAAVGRGCACAGKARRGPGSCGPPTRGSVPSTGRPLTGRAARRRAVLCCAAGLATCRRSS